ncbi:efflux RND transporter permease subunit [Thalassotalea sediminis]|uniref:efflux RND transporter permease subunit n=1 Tax=Thalassotalea sediminis TaxID=1759089 RepID=UPI002572E82F|nr:CusA/CzcA family heavy metal efflux RND transporter [Thalassotalea sediminis]
MFNILINGMLKNRILVVITLIITIVAALMILPKLNLDAFPEVTNVQVVVNTEAPGLAAEEVEQLITYPIEAVMYALPDVAQVRSISKTGLSGVTVVFKEGTDIYFARQLVFERLQTAKALIPEGIGAPEMGPNTSGLGQIYQYLLLADKSANYDAMTLRSLNDWVVKLLIMPVDGVTDVLSFGGSVKQYQVNLNPNKLLSFALTQQQVIDALQSNNTNVGGWYIARGQEQLAIRGTGWFASGEQGIEQIKKVPLKTIDGTVVTLADVANVEFGSEIRQGAVTMTRRGDHGEIESMGEVVTGIVLKRIGANSNATIGGITERVDIINQALPKGVRFEPFYDQGELIKNAVMTVIKSLAIAFVFISIVLLLFLMDLSATFLVLISIPISIAVALMAMSLMGMSANLMSLGGIAIAIGMLVDGSVVMIENIVKRLTALEHHKTSQQLTSNIVRQTIEIAAKEVARPIFFASAIILVVFAPIFSFEGVEAKLFQPMAISIMIAVVFATCVALFVMPALASLVMRRRHTSSVNNMMKQITTLYKRALTYALLRVKTIVGVAGLALIAACLLYQKLGTEFVPALEEGTINLRVTLAPSASLNTALDVATMLEKKLMQFPEVTYALSRIGRAEIGGDPEPVNNIEIYIGLKPVAQWTTAKKREALQVKIEESLAQFPGLLFNFSQPIATRVDELLSGVKAQLAIKLFGPDLTILAQKGREIEFAIKQIAGTRDVAMEQITGEAQLVITPNRQALSRFGLSVASVMDVVSKGVGGTQAGQIITGNERYDIYVRLDKPYRSNTEAIADIRIQSSSGAWVRLGDVAVISYESGVPQIRRDDVQRRVVIQTNVQGRDMGSVVKEIKQTIDQNIQLPAGYTVSMGGQFESQQRAQKRLSLVIPLSLTLIAILLYFAFGSIGQAMLILLNVPLAVIGGVFSLYLSGQYLSVPSAVGFITLFGVAVLNGVVMVESINQQLTSTKDISSAVIDGASSRFRPVMMTAITSALGLIPMLMSTGIGAEIQRPLASVVVGGLLTSTLLTLVILPVLYRRFSRAKIAKLKGESNA